MSGFLKFIAFLVLAGAVFFFGVYFGQQKITVKVKPTGNTPSPSIALSSTPIEKIYADSYFDVSFSYPNQWETATKMSKNRSCDFAKKFLRNPSCSGDITSETLYVNSPEKDSNAKQYGITIEAATEGLGFACADTIEKNYSVTVKGKTYKFDACQDPKSGEEWGLSEMEVTGIKSEWKSILVNFSAKDAGMTQDILKVLSSIE